MYNSIKVITLAGLILVTSSCSRNPVTGKKEVMLMSESQEISMGKSADPEVIAQYGLYDNSTLQSFINTKGKEMASISHRPNLPFEFKILDSHIVNAFALPGGYVYFTRGIMGHFNNEAEFMGVLGHEIGHVTARHTGKMMTKQMLTQIAFIGGLIVSADFRKFADVAQQGVGLLFLKFSRDHESESDKLGVDYSTKVGYNAHEMAGFFKTLQSLSGDEGRIPSFLSTHPDPGDRFTKVGKLADEAQKTIDPSTLKVNRENYLRMIDGLMYGEDPKQGYVENNIFYHPELKFQFPVPQNWKHQNSPSQFQMAPEDGKAMMVMTLAQGSNLEEAKGNVIKENKLTVLESTNISVNGLPAIAMLSDVIELDQNGQPTQGEPLKVLTYLIEYNKLIYKIHGLAAKKDFNFYFASFQNTMKNFKVLTDQAKINKKSTHIKLVTTNKSATLLQHLNDNKMPSSKHKELAILNGMDLTENISSGSMIKVLTGGGI
jgi:predicted Zn-dependent protease